MQKRVYLSLFLLGLVIALATAYLQSSPGYMDAYYYYYGGTRLAEGYGLSEMILWNYLDDPSGLPHTAFSYWMPFTSFLAAAGIKLFSGFLGVYRGAQAVFILIAASIPPITAALSWELTNNKRYVWITGVLAAFMGYYLPFVVAIDAFGVYMLLGGLFFLVAAKPGRSRYFILGIIAGIMHLTRADGLLWLGIGGLGPLMDALREDETNFIKTIFSKAYISQGLVVIGGYLLVLLPWFIRNYVEFGAILSPGGSKTMWVLNYDELFSYPADILTFSRWWAAGFNELISVRFEALLVNLQSTFASLGMIFPGVLAGFGIFRSRRNSVVHLAGVYWLLLIFVMTVVFPFAGIRGGFFHSGSALMPVIWVMIPIGMQVVTEWSVKTFRWETRKIRPFYIGLLFLYVVLFSFGISFTKIVGDNPETAPVWNVTLHHYKAVEESIQEHYPGSDEIIVTINPPAYTVLNDRPSIGMPDGGVDSLLDVIQRYQARFVLLEPSHPDDLDELFLEPQDVGSLKYQDTIQNTHLFVWEGEW